MKKRLLALALCLVMVSSLLPITAAAYTEAEMLGWVHGITDNGTYCKEASFTINCPEGYNVSSVEVDTNVDGTFDLIIPPVGQQYKISGHLGLICVVIHLQGANSSPDLVLFITIHDDHTDNNADHKCDNCGESAHTWQFKAAGNTLTGSCGGANCDIREVVLTLEADSVTLPKSPFETAQLVGWNDFQTATGAGKEDFVYRYKGPGDETFGNPFYADPAKIKAGQYQVGVTITNLPGNVEDGNVAARANTNSAYLFTQYTAADPAVTAQTGDDRPIEIMLVSALAFSALAAAAFVLDGKRKYRQ